MFEDICFDSYREKYLEMAEQEKDYLVEYMRLGERLTQLLNAPEFSGKEYDEISRQAADIKNKYEGIREERKKLALALLDMMWNM